MDNVEKNNKLEVEQTEVTDTNETNLIETQKSGEELKSIKRKKIWMGIIIFIAIVLLVFLAIEIAYIADFIRYKGTDSNGLLLTKAQRVHGLFGIFKEN
ncbi:hypothetical protein [[Mycoplasma] gypis]|uniref:Uncharacterized protein n=1 Tax=[Mycoplasma] gypis TaxID=92404 RepID=A0ABZ2RMQ6_9BACT|nr:hypothetical protein [[Mycoplasma] gypis]MBN0919541.1 hypothetical protein [[Mycoplasma] gypis]